MTVQDSPRLLIHGGTVIDGLDNAPRRADVLVADERIVAVENDLNVCTQTSVPPEQT